MNPQEQQLFLDIIQPENRMFLEVQIAELLFGNTTATDFKYNCIRYLQNKTRGYIYEKGVSRPKTDYFEENIKDGFNNILRFRRKV